MNERGRPERRGLYSLLQFIPDLARNEAINVGVYLFASDKGEVASRIITNHTRIRKVFPHASLDSKRLGDLKRGLDHLIRSDFALIKSEKDLRDYVARFSNHLRLTEPNPIHFDDPAEEIDRLFIQLVDEPQRPRMTQYENSASPKLMSLKDVLSDPEVRLRLVRNIRIEVPTLPEPVAAEYAYKNGALNMIRTVNASLKDPERNRQQITDSAVIGRELSNTRKGHALVVVGSFADDGLSSWAHEFLPRYNVRLFSSDQMKSLKEDILHSSVEPDMFTKKK